MSRAEWSVGNLHSVALIDLEFREYVVPRGWEPSFCSLDRLTTNSLYVISLVGNLHSVALIDLSHPINRGVFGWEPSFCSLDRLIQSEQGVEPVLGTFIL